MNHRTVNHRITRGLVALALLAAAWPASAQQNAPAAGMPPLIDRELFFGDPELSGAQISPDGKYLTFLKPFKGTRNIWVKGVDEPFDKARPISADTKRPIAAYFWSRDSKFVLYVQDQGGDENYNVYAVDPADAPAAGQDVPAARNITNAAGVRAVIYSVPRSEPDAIYVGLNDRDKAWHDLYKVRISTGERTRLRENTDRITGWIFDTKDQLRVATRSADNGDTEILRVDPSGFSKIYSCTVLESCGPLRFHKDGQHVYLESNRGGSDLAELRLMDVQTGAEQAVESDPMKRVDLWNVIFSDASDDLLATVYADDKFRVNWKDPAWEADYKFLKQQLGDRELGLGSHTTDERIWVISASSDVEPGETFLFDRKTRTLTRQYRVRETLPREALSEMRPVRYKSSDGLEIPAYLTLPRGAATRNLPLVVFPHGGPWARDMWGYNPISQFLANRGYAVLQPNFRGSTGYGKKFLDAGNNEWGQKMQDDITWGVKHLIAEGIADPKRVGIMGGSYGGYATLAGVTFTPDVYAAGVSIVGPSNLITLLDSIPPYWEAGRKVFHTRMGDPTTPAGKAQLEKQSPLNSADKIHAALLVVQGANDPRVNKAESDQIVVALRDRGFPVEYLVAPDEGHGFARPVNNLAMFAAAEKFLASHLGGRFQESMTPEVATRLKEITVDPKTVTLDKRTTSAAPVGVPKVASTLQPGTVNYLARIQAGEQKVEFPTSREIKAEGDTWVITETAKLPMGEAVDTTVLDKSSLALKRRTIHQGPVDIAFATEGGKAKGEMKMSGQAQPIDADLGGDLFADGAGAHAVIAALPLAEGYTTSFRNFDVRLQKTKIMNLKVVGSEQVTVPAGTFDAYKVEISAAGDAGRTTIWVSKADRTLVKASSVVPQMNGAVITTELQKAGS